jgi:hypothetical protein
MHFRCREELPVSGCCQVFLLFVAAHWILQRSRGRVDLRRSGLLKPEIGFISGVQPERPAAILLGVEVPFFRHASCQFQQLTMISDWNGSSG